VARIKSCDITWVWGPGAYSKAAMAEPRRVIGIKCLRMKETDTLTYLTIKATKVVRERIGLFNRVTPSN
jgi:hypothetical protein